MGLFAELNPLAISSPDCCAATRPWSKSIHWWIHLTPQASKHWSTANRPGVLR